MTQLINGLMVGKVEDFIGKWATNLKRDTVKSQTVRGEPVEPTSGLTAPLRHAQDERSSLVECPV